MSANIDILLYVAQSIHVLLNNSFYLMCNKKPTIPGAVIYV